MSDKLLSDGCETGFNNEMAARSKKLELSKTYFGFNYSNSFRRSAKALDLQERYQNHTAEELTLIDEIFSVCGRISAIRRMGKLVFIKMHDDSGAIQIILSPNNLTVEEFKQWMDVLDLGDLIGVTGTICKTNRGELSLRVHSIELLAKAMRPLSEKYHGVVDPEIRQRRRYLELIGNAGARERFILRSKIIQAARAYFLEEEFLEVETPMMHPIPGGAAARPFITHHHALGQDFYLRIAPELYLKRLVVGGFEKIFELNRNFRNEGISSRHNPEFTMLEFYQAYVGYQEMMDHVQRLIQYVAEKVFKTLTLSIGDYELDLSQPFKRQTLLESLQSRFPEIDAAQLLNQQFLQNFCQTQGIKVHDHWGVGEYQFAIFEAFVEPNLIEPTFIIGYPTSVSPLARPQDGNQGYAERFELFVAGRELANGFSELNDPALQKEIFQHQEKNKQAGDSEAMHFDQDYIEALESGLPHTGGVGIGIDRLVMWLTNSSNIREIILFPTLKRK